MLNIGKEQHGVLLFSHGLWLENVMKQHYTTASNKLNGPHILR